MSIRTKNILTVLIPVLLLGGFVFAAEGLKDDKKDERLAALERATTSTTVRSTTTTGQPTTTTSSTVLSTTTTLAVSSPTTTAAPRTSTTRRATTATTRRATPPAPSTPNPTFNGAGTESADNTGSFTRNGEGSYSGAGAPSCASTDPFCFYLSSSDNGSGVRLTATIRNNTNRTVRFPNDPNNPSDDGLRIRLTVNGPMGSQQVIMDASSVKTLPSKEGLAISSTTTFPDNGQYTFTGVCDIDYGQ